MEPGWCFPPARLDVVSPATQPLRRQLTDGAGENLEDVAKHFGVTVQELVYHNYNLMTHIDNPLTLVSLIPRSPRRELTSLVQPSGDVVCVVSRLADAVVSSSSARSDPAGSMLLTQDAGGSPICMPR